MRHSLRNLCCTRVLAKQTIRYMVFNKPMKILAFKCHTFGYLFPPEWNSAVYFTILFFTFLKFCCSTGIRLSRRKIGIGSLYPKVFISYEWNLVLYVTTTIPYLYTFSCLFFFASVNQSATVVSERRRRREVSQTWSLTNLLSVFHLINIARSFF